jgi:hypothetical protein
MAIFTDSPGQTSTVSFIEIRGEPAAVGNDERGERRRARLALEHRNWNPCRCIACGMLEVMLRMSQVSTALRATTIGVAGIS